MSHKEAAGLLRRTGYSSELVDEVLARLPDPFDLDDEEPILSSYGLTADQLIDKMGGSP